MKIFLDANILVTVLNKEYPRFSECARVLSLADKQNSKLFVTPLTLGITWYFVTKKSGENLARKKMEELLNHISVVEVNEEAIKNVLLNKKIKDFEDGMQYYAAVNSNCKVIITANKKDFYFSEIDVLDAKEFLEKHFI